MRKKYLSALLFGALLVTSAGTFTSCKDYDDDIKNLQEQVDKLANLPTTESMKAAIDEAKKGLQTEIDGLKGQLEELQNSDQTEKIKDLEARIKVLEDKLSDYDDLKGRIEKLESIDHSQYLTSEDIAGLIGVDELDAAIEGLLKKDGENYSGAVVDYVQTVLAAQTVSKTEFNDLKTAWDAFVAGSGDNALTLKDIQTKLSDLELYKSATENSITEAGFADFDAVLAQIKATQDELAGLSYPSKEEVEGIKNSLDALTGRVTAIEGELKNLGIDVESLKSMIQSIVFMPFADGSKVVNISTLKTKVTDAESGNVTWTALQSNDTRKLKFRVSPASAAENIAENYIVDVYADKLSRSENPIEVKSVTSLGGGLVEVEISANKLVDDYAVCLHVTPNKEVEENKDKNTDITSDYFVVNTGILYLQGMTLTAPADADKLIIEDGKVKAVDFNESTVMLSVCDVETPDPLNHPAVSKELSELGLEKDDLNIEYSINPTNQYFSMTDGVLSVAEGKDAPANAGQNVPVDYKVSFKDAVEGQAEFNGSSLTTTYIYWVANIDCGEYTVKFNSTSDTRTPINEGLTDEIEKNLNVTDITTGVDYSGLGNGNVRFAQNSDIYVAAGTAEAPELIEGTYTANTYNIVNVKAKVTIDSNISAAVHEDSQWRDGNIFIPFVPASDNLVYGNLTQIYSNYDAISAEVTAMGGTLQFVPVLPEDAKQGLATITGSSNETMTIDPSKYQGEVIGVKLQAVFGSTTIDIENSLANVKIFDYNNLSGTLVTTTPVSITFEKPSTGGSSTAQPVYGADWSWQVVDGTNLFGTASNPDEFSKYGLLTEVVLEGEAAEWLVVTPGTNAKATKINVNPEKWTMTTLLDDKTFEIPIKFYTPWESISESEDAWTEKTVTVKVTIKKWNENN